MNRDMLKGEWNQVKGRVRNAWGELTDDDLARVQGDWEQLVGAIQKRTGQVREDIERGLDHLLDRIAEETRSVPPAADAPEGPRTA